MAEHPNIKVVFVPLQDFTHQYDDRTDPLIVLRNIVSNADTMRFWGPPEGSAATSCWTSSR